MYPKGMFHLEVSGPAKISGTLILPPGDKTYLVHCDIAQHMEKGMKAQLKVGDGDGDLPSIPGVTAPVVPDDYNAGLAEVFAAAKVTEAEIEAANVALAVAEAAKKAGQKAAATQTDSFVSGVTVIGLAIGLIISAVMGRKFQGKSIAEVTTYSFGLLGMFIGFIKRLVSRLINLVFSSKNKVLPSK
jgi:hypothetical protein